MILTMHRQESFSLNSTRNRFHGYSARNYFPEIDQKMLMFRGYSARNYYPEINKKAVSQIFSKQLLSQLFSKKYFPWTRQEISIGGYSARNYSPLKSTRSQLFSKKLFPWTRQEISFSVTPQELISLNSAINRFCGYSARSYLPELDNKSALLMQQGMNFNGNSTRNGFLLNSTIRCYSTRNQPCWIWHQFCWYSRTPGFNKKIIYSTRNHFTELDKKTHSLSSTRKQFACAQH